MRQKRKKYFRGIHTRVGGVKEKLGFFNYVSMCLMINHEQSADICRYRVAAASQGQDLVLNCKIINVAEFELQDCVTLLQFLFSTYDLFIWM